MITAMVVFRCFSELGLVFCTIEPLRKMCQNQKYLSLQRSCRFLLSFRLCSSFLSDAMQLLLGFVSFVFQANLFSGWSFSCASGKWHIWHSCPVIKREVWFTNYNFSPGKEVSLNTQLKTAFDLQRFAYSFNCYIMAKDAVAAPEYMIFACMWLFLASQSALSCPLQESQHS